MIGPDLLTNFKFKKIRENKMTKKIAKMDGNYKKIFFYGIYKKVKFRFFFLFF